MSKHSSSLSDSNQTPAYYTLAKAIKTATLLHEINTALNLLDNHLAYHSFLVDHEISASDWAIWGAIRGQEIKIVSLYESYHFPI